MSPGQYFLGSELRMSLTEIPFSATSVREIELVGCAGTNLILNEGSESDMGEGAYRRLDWWDQRRRSEQLE